ncbi:hypothetical protein BVC80_1195g53 [Macleaya cordata]|uniref:Low temperature viability protein n=1 Tax=Macleaya cordata TaxID=56857 RepID=A0A200RCG6_MACCD|nr:hypothetical protein BVC80_1195g53 [Macleaya cordata]
MGKKKFIDKKKSATFQLLARDTSDPNYEEGPNGDRVFVRVDNNPLSIEGFGEEEGEDPDSIFADPPEDDVVENHLVGEPSRNRVSNGSSLPDNLRKEILELGLPDDGYNYLLHLREIKKTGGGSAFYENPKAKLEQLPNDVKAYDASRVPVLGLVNDTDTNDSSIYNVAAKTVGVRIKKAVDEEVAALLDDGDLSRFGSDVEDLEEDFVVQANLPEEGEDGIVDKKINEQPEVIKRENIESGNFVPREGEFFGTNDSGRQHQTDEKPRVPRFLDEQFELLTLREYGSDSDSEHRECGPNSDCESEDPIPEVLEPFLVRLNNSLKERGIEDLEIDNKYKVPADFVHGNEVFNNEKLVDSAVHLIRRCVEYGEKYNDESQDKEELVIWEESSDESEEFDCETVVSTYSNLDNHPGKIEAPVSTRKKKPSQTVPAVSSNSGHMISLRGKEKLPVEFLPHLRKPVVDKVTRVSGLKTDQHKRKPHGEESKEEKKERKAAVKEERREARKVKKEMKVVYKGEAQRAQKVAAISGPSSIHLL